MVRPSERASSPPALLRIVLATLLASGVSLAAVAFPTPTSEASGPTVLGPDDEIFSDDFETGDVSRWSSAVNFLPMADPFRFSDLDLRDPHVFVEINVGIPVCIDATDDSGFGVSINDNLATAITTDGDGDGLLDLSALLLFRPLDPTLQGLRLDLAQGRCTAPVEITECEPEPLVPATELTYTSETVGDCLIALPGTTSGYAPGIAEPTAPCFVTPPQTLMVDFLGVPLELGDAQIAGSYVGDPVTSLEDGLLFGFLSETDADALVLPADLPIVGGLPLSALFPGGAGNCASGDDRDTHLGVVGWWIYFNYRADVVPFSGP